MESWRTLEESHGLPKTFKTEEDRDQVLNIKHLDGGFGALVSDHDPFRNLTEIYFN